MVRQSRSFTNFLLIILALFLGFAGISGCGILVKEGIQGRIEYLMADTGALQAQPNTVDFFLVNYDYTGFSDYVTPGSILSIPAAVLDIFLPLPYFKTVEYVAFSFNGMSREKLEIMKVIGQKNRTKVYKFSENYNKIGIAGNNIRETFDQITDTLGLALSDEVKRVYQKAFGKFKQR